MRDELQYIINEEKRTVTCIAWGCTDDLIVNMLKKTSDGNHVDLIIRYQKELLLKDKYIGTAKCSPEDIFDIETGKKIARAKMREKYTRDKLKNINKLAENFTSFMWNLDDSYDAVLESYKKNYKILSEFN